MLCVVPCFGCNSDCSNLDETKKIHVKEGIVGCYRDTHCGFMKCCYSRDKNCLCDRPECKIS